MSRRESVNPERHLLAGRGGPGQLPVAVHVPDAAQVAERRVDAIGQQGSGRLAVPGDQGVEVGVRHDVGSRSIGRGDAERAARGQAESGRQDQE